MQPVQHCINYYEAFLSTADANDWPHLQLRQQIQHYRTLNGTWTWTARANFSSERQTEIPFDPDPTKR